MSAVFSLIKHLRRKYQDLCLLYIIIGESICRSFQVCYPCSWFCSSINILPKLLRVGSCIICCCFLFAFLIISSCLSHFVPEPMVYLQFIFIQIATFSIPLPGSIFLPDNLNSFCIPMIFVFHCLHLYLPCWYTCHCIK